MSRNAFSPGYSLQPKAVFRLGSGFAADTERNLKYKELGDLELGVCLSAVQ